MARISNVRSTARRDADEAYTCTRLTETCWEGYITDALTSSRENARNIPLLLLLSIFPRDRFPSTSIREDSSGNGIAGVVRRWGMKQCSALCWWVLNHMPNARPSRTVIPFTNTKILLFTCIRAEITPSIMIQLTNGWFIQQCASSFTYPWRKENK
jgi:hypothetical protein